MARDLIVRFLSARQEARIGGASAPGGAMHPDGEQRRWSVQRALAVSCGLIARAWRNGKPRALSVSYVMTVLKWTAIIALCLYLGLAAVLYLAQRSLLYFPETIHTTPAQAGLPEAEEVMLTASDGVHVIGWHVAPRDGKPVILYFHGNGGALRYRVERFKKLIADGIGLVALEYRGYGGSGGSPSERGLIADGAAAYADAGEAAAFAGCWYMVTLCRITSSASFSTRSSSGWVDGSAVNRATT